MYWHLNHFIISLRKWWWLEVLLWTRVPQNTYPVRTEHCQWNTCCTANASSTLYLLLACQVSIVVGITTHLPISEHVCASRGPCDPERAHKCKQRNRSITRSGMNGSQVSHSRCLSVKRKLHERFSGDFLTGKTPNERWHTHTHYIHIDATDHISLMHILRTE